MSANLPLPTPFNADTKLNTINGIVTPAVPEDETYGYLYKKSEDDGLFWKTLGNGEVNLTSGLNEDSFGTATSILTSTIITTLSNTKSGTSALLTLGNATLGGANTAYGKSALTSLPDDSSNTCFSAFGYNAGSSVTTGSNSLFMGAFSGKSIVTSVNNVFLGHFCGSNVTNGVCQNNIAIGYTTFNGVATNTVGNVAIGTQSLKALTVGNGNVSIGENAAMALTNGSFNVITGYNACQNSGTVSRNIAIGNSALANVSSNSNVAIGDETMVFLLGGNLNTAVGAGTGANTISGSSNVFVGYQSKAQLENYSNCIAIGALSNASADSQIRIGFNSIGSSVQTSTYIDGIYAKTVDVGTGIPVNIDNTGKIGTTLSSKKYKHDVKLLDDNLINKVYDLEPVSFIMNGDSNNNINYGLIAEEVRDVIPELVVFQDGLDDDGKKSVLTVKYQYLAPLLLGAVKQLKEENIEMKKQIQQLLSV